MNKQQRILVLAILCLTFAGMNMLGPLAFWGAREGELLGYLAFFAAGGLLGEVCLLATWSALGAQSAVVRLPIAFALLVVASCSFLIGLRIPDDGIPLDPIIALFIASVMMFVSMQVPLWIMRLKSRCRIDLRDAPALNKEQEAVQFGLRHLLIWTAVISVLVVLIKASLPPELTLTVTPWPTIIFAMVVFAVWITLVGVPCIRLALEPQIRGMWIGWLIVTTPDDAHARAGRFLAIATILAVVGVLMTPGAVRVHHFLNVAPLPHLCVAAAAMALWSRARRRRARVAIALGLAGIAATGTHLASTTLSEIRSTGGLGRWSSELARLGRELERTPGRRVTSLDWGFHGPLRFTSRTLDLEEPFWSWWRPGPRRGPWSRRGDARDVYLLPIERLAVFPFGADFRRAAAGLPSHLVEVRSHPDASAAARSEPEASAQLPATAEREADFTSVRILAPHRVDRRVDGFEIVLLR